MHVTRDSFSCTMNAPTTQRDFQSAGLAPRALSRTEAARYCGLGVTTFDKAIRDCLLPRPFRIYSRVLWCRQALDAALDVLRDAQAEANSDASGDTWGDYK
jgi:predicted DNA-binding transcriptional regulator AlpA